MRRAIATVASLILSLGIAAPAAAGPPDGANYTWDYATTSYVSDLSPHAPGVHSRLSVTYSAVVDRTGGGTHTRSVVQVITSGYKLSDTGDMEYDWYGGYEWVVTPENPSLGGIDASLSDAWLAAGPMTSFCSGNCPAMPAQISVSATWVAIGVPTVTASLPTDDIGGVSSLIYRTRPATASIAFTGGSLDVPPILTGSLIRSQVQIYRPPKP
jgi:hypothetical protein